MSHVPVPPVLVHFCFWFIPHGLVFVWLRYFPLLAFCCQFLPLWFYSLHFWVSPLKLTFGSATCLSLCVLLTGVFLCNRDIKWTRSCHWSLCSIVYFAPTRTKVFLPVPAGEWFSFSCSSAESGKFFRAQWKSTFTETRRHDLWHHE